MAAKTAIAALPPAASCRTAASERCGDRLRETALKKPVFTM
jgi:hypothetical protein